MGSELSSSATTIREPSIEEQIAETLKLVSPTYANAFKLRQTEFDRCVERTGKFDGSIDPNQISVPRPDPGKTCLSLPETLDDMAPAAELHLENLEQARQQKVIARKFSI